MYSQKEKQTVKTTHNDWFTITNRDISNQDTITVIKEFDTLREISKTHIPNDEYENFMTIYIEAAAAECTLKIKCRVSWETLVGRKKHDIT